MGNIIHKLNIEYGPELKPVVLAKLAINAARNVTNDGTIIDDGITTNDGLTTDDGLATDDGITTDDGLTTDDGITITVPTRSRTTRDVRTNASTISTRLWTRRIILRTNATSLVVDVAKGRKKE